MPQARRARTNRRVPTSMSAWSFSRFQTDATCNRQAELKYLSKVQELPRPLPPGKTEHANDRGSRIHTLAEKWVPNTTARSLPHELAHFLPEFDQLQQLYQEGRVTLEQSWNFDISWRVLPNDVKPGSKTWKKIWLRLKADIVVWLSPTEAVLIDLKTGKRQRNEIKHAEQMQLYQLCAFMRFPELQRVTTELWYTDLDELHSAKFTRDFGLRFFPRWNERGLAMTSRTRHIPNPSINNCRFCPYKDGSNKWVVGTGHCSLNPPDPKFDDPTELYENKMREILGDAA